MLRSKLFGFDKGLFYIQSRLKMSLSKKPSAGIIIIGDEILKGQTQDTNTHFLATNLKLQGIQLKRVSVIPDEIDTIAEEVKQFSTKYDLVLTSGGVGPTHDDVTFEGVAKAFDDQTFLHPEIAELITNYFKEVNDAVLKLAQVPTRSKLNYPTVLPPGQVRYPLVSVENVYIFPGIPSLLQRAFIRLKDDLFSFSDFKSHVEEVFVVQSEVHLAEKLNKLVEKYKESVVFGSYPTWTHNYYNTKITVEAEEPKLVEQVVEELKNQLPTIDFDKHPLENTMEKIEAFAQKSSNESFKRSLESSLKTLEKCFQDFKPEEVSVAFNGGKDNIAMIHLVHAFLQKQQWKGKLDALYIEEPDPFTEVEEFMREAEKSYNINLVKIKGPMKSALSEFLKSRPNVKAMVLGTRKGDPGSHNQGAFAPTDGDWPALMRVNPVLDWNYHDIWTFIRGLSVPYPTLYDKGYTSLGSKSNTAPNPNLSFKDSKGQVLYKPAYELENGNQERAGRLKSSV